VTRCSVCNEMSCTSRVRAGFAVQVDLPRSVKCTAFQATSSCTYKSAGKVSESAKAVCVDLVVLSVFQRQNYLLYLSPFLFR
jgi:hypothetical protein